MWSALSLGGVSQWIRDVVLIVPLGSLFVWFIRSWCTRVTADIEKRVLKTELAIHVNHFREGLEEVNGELKRSFDKLCDKLDEQGKSNIELIKEVAKLSQRVEDLTKLNGKRAT